MKTQRTAGLVPLADTQRLLPAAVTSKLVRHGTILLLAGRKPVIAHGPALHASPNLPPALGPTAPKHTPCTDRFLLSV